MYLQIGILYMIIYNFIFLPKIILWKFPCVKVFYFNINFMAV